MWSLIINNFFHSGYLEYIPWAFQFSINVCANILGVKITSTIIIVG